MIPTACDDDDGGESTGLGGAKHIYDTVYAEAYAAAYSAAFPERYPDATLTDDNIDVALDSSDDHDGVDADALIADLSEAHPMLRTFFASPEERESEALKGRLQEQLASLPSSMRIASLEAEIRTPSDAVRL